MKKIIKVAGIFIISLLSLLIILPIVFKPQIQSLVKEKINENVDAKVNFEDFNLSLIKNFPNLSISLKKLSVSGKAKFEGDTLVSFNSFDISVNPLPAIKGEDLEIKTILLDSPVLNGIILEDGTANWDIAPETEKEETEEDKEKEENEDNYEDGSSQGVNLKKFEIKNARISYNDRKSNMHAILNNLNFLMTGDLASDFTSIDLNLIIDEITFIQGGIKLANKTSFGLKINADADLDKMLFTIKENELSLNDLILSVIGNVEMKDEAIITDLKFKTNQTDFKSILSLVPAVYLNDFSDVKTSGSFGIEGEIKGKLIDSITPSAKIDFNIKNGMFNYPDLPKSVNKINLGLNIDYNGEDVDKTVVDLSRFSFELGNNPFLLRALIKTPISDMFVKAGMKGKINFNSLKDVVPLDNTEITGLLETNIDLQANMSQIENEKYEDVKAEGLLNLSNFNYVSKDFPQGAEINELKLNFTPKIVELLNLELKTGESDIKLKGELRNFIPYIFAGDTISGNLALNSNMLNINEFMGNEENNKTEEITEEETNDTSSAEVVEVPGNINFDFNADIKKIIYDKLEISNTFGLISIRNSSVQMKKLNMKLLEGSMMMNGEYSTADIKNPLVDFNLDMNKMDISSAYNSLTMIQDMAPVAKNCDGKFSMKINFNSSLNSDMSLKYETVEGYGNLKSEEVTLKSSNALSKISDKLKTKKFKDAKIKDLDIDFTIQNGRIYLKPFTTQLNSTDVEISGSQGIDQTMDYTMGFKIPASDLPSSIGGLAAKAGVGSTIDVNALIKGTFEKPKVSIDIGDAVIGNLKSKFKDELNKKKEKTIEQGKEELKKEAQQKIKQAEQKAAEIKKQARLSAKKIIKESDKQADKLVKNANNPIAKKAAEKTGGKLKKDARKEAQNLINNADKKADAIIEKAKREAE